MLSEYKGFPLQCPRLYTRTEKDVALLGSQCKRCGKVYFPRKMVCPECFVDEMEERALSGRGKLYSFTITTVAPSGFEVPYAFGWVDLDEGPRAFSLLCDCEPFEEKLRLDMPVEMVIGRLRKDETGQEIMGYKFRPVKGS